MSRCSSVSLLNGPNIVFATTRRLPQFDHAIPAVVVGDLFALVRDEHHNPFTAC